MNIYRVLACMVGACFIIAIAMLPFEYILAIGLVTFLLYVFDL